MIVLEGFSSEKVDFHALLLPQIRLQSKTERRLLNVKRRVNLNRKTYYLM